MVAEATPHKETTVFLVGYYMFETTAAVMKSYVHEKTLKAIFDSTEYVKFFISPDFKFQFFNRKVFENWLLLHGKK